MFKPAEGSSTCMINNKTTEVSTTSSTTATTAPALTSIVSIHKAMLLSGNCHCSDKLTFITKSDFCK